MLLKAALKRKDLLWGYFAQIFAMTSGMLILPVLLKHLSQDEIAIYYIFLNIAGLAMLLDFGFAGQLSRNIAYVYSGVSSIEKIGINRTFDASNVDYQLLKNTIAVSRDVYRRLAAISFLILITIGLVYILQVTKSDLTNFKFVVLWFLFSLSIFLNTRYSYLSSLLTGSGDIIGAQKAMFYSKLIQVALSIMLAYLKFGLYAPVLGSLSGGILYRFICHKYYFTKELRNSLRVKDSNVDAQKEILKNIWFNTKKLGIINLFSSYTIVRLLLSMYGFYAPLKEVAQYGLMLQLFGVLSQISYIFFRIKTPKISSMISQNKTDAATLVFGQSVILFIFLFTAGSFFVIYFGNQILVYASSNVLLPGRQILITFIVFALAESNNDLFVDLISFGNVVPYLKSRVLTSGLTLILSPLLFLIFQSNFTAVFIIHGLFQCTYNYWRWPYYCSKLYGISVLEFYLKGVRYFLNIFKVNHLNQTHI